MSPASKNSIENSSCSCFVWGQCPLEKSQLGLQRGTKYFVRPPCAALINEGLCRARGWGWVSLGHVPCCFVVDVVCGFAF